MLDYRSLNMTLNEMMVHLPLCTHKEASKTLVIGSVCDGLKTELEKHTTDVEYGDLTLLNSKNEKEIDVIVFTDVKIDEFVLANIDKVLKDDGLIVFTTESYHNGADRLKSDLTLVGTKFWIAMPFKFGHSTSIIASKKYHPTADLILQRADLLDGLDYYSSEIHTASFVFPTKIKKDLTGIAKR